MGATESKHVFHVVLPDGGILDVEEEITVGEVILSFPHCFVTSAEQILKGATGKRLKLPADTILSYGKTYYVRPQMDRHKSRTKWAKDAEVAAVLVSSALCALDKGGTCANLSAIGASKPKISRLD